MWTGVSTLVSLIGQKLSIARIYTVHMVDFATERFVKMVGSGLGEYIGFYGCGEIRHRGNVRVVSIEIHPVNE